MTYFICVSVVYMFPIVTLTAYPYLLQLVQRLGQFFVKNKLETKRFSYSLVISRTTLEAIHRVVFRHSYAIPPCLCWYIYSAFRLGKIAPMDIAEIMF